MKEDVPKSGVNFTLQPFTFGSTADELSISGYLARATGTLFIEYVVRGSLACIKRSVADPVSRRCHGLWRHTCFEFFVGKKSEPVYWEVNLSLSGGWNVYRFDGYRTGMQEVLTMGQPLCTVSMGTDFLSLSCNMELNGIIADSSELEVGVSSVMETIDGTTSYWAIEHQGPEPDFHNRRSFLVLLPGLET